MKVAIFSGGEFTATKILPYDKLICADKGYSYAQELGLTPDYIVGDFDSLNYVPQGAEVYSSDKDFSDTELATKRAISLGCSEIDYYFCLGGRIDHELFNISLLKTCKDNAINGRIIDKKQTVYLLTSEDKNAIFTAKKGCFVSIVPTTCTVEFENSNNLKYSLKNLVVKTGETKTLSNVATSNEFCVNINKGEALVIVNG